MAVTTQTTQIPPSDLDFVDENRRLSTSWYRWFYSVFQALGSGLNILNIGIVNASFAVESPQVLITSDGGLAFRDQTSDVGGATATLTNSPTAGDPAFWLRVTVNGADYVLPAWPA